MVYKGQKQNFFVICYKIVQCKTNAALRDEITFPKYPLHNPVKHNTKKLISFSYKPVGKEFQRTSIRLVVFLLKANANWSEYRHV